MMKTILISLVATLALTGQGFSQAGGKRFEVDPAASSIKWHGAKVGTDHFGKVRLKSGWLTLDGEQVTGGEFVADMTSISNDDLTSKSQNAKLVKHLMSDDFFNTKKFPESKVVIAKATPKGEGRHELEGLITIRNISQPLTFTAHITVAGDTLTGKGKLTFNRAKHEVKFHSGTAAKLGDKLIYDDVPLDVELVARAK
jgi:polyisoprenoid-binding protein YceI